MQLSPGLLTTQHCSKFFNRDYDYNKLAALEMMSNLELYPSSFTF